MAKLYYANCEKKCSLWNDLQLGLWSWFIIIQCLINLPCVLSRCQGIDKMSLGLYPEGSIYIVYGEPLEIFCMDVNATAEDLEFIIGSVTKISSKKYNSTTRRLYFNQHEKGVYTYSCRNKITNEYCSTRVLVDSYPLDVTDFSCMSRNLDVLNCTWTASKTYIITNYSLTMPIQGKVKPCIPEKRGLLRYCSWNTSSHPRYRQMEKQLLFDLKTCNRLGCNQQNFTIDHYSIVKPDPPMQVKVLRNGSHSILLQWSIPNNMVDLLPRGVQHRIEYQIAKIDNTTFFHRVNTSSLPAHNKTYKFLLTNLPYAHMQYEVRIYIRPIEATKEEFWSDFNYIIFHTSSERPQRPPDTAAGAFDQALYETKRVIIVYWRQLEQLEEAGSNFTYKVATYNDNQGDPEILLADPKKSLNYVIIDHATLGAIDIHIWSINDNGSSRYSTHLYIPPYKDTQDLKISSFTKLAYENGTYKLSWVGIENIDNYTLFWCQYSIPKICSDKINFTTLEPERRSYIVDLPKDNKYQFAISANRGAKTSGMVWTTCDISKDNLPMHKFPLNLRHGRPGKTFLKLFWSIRCASALQDTITGYLITYCPISSLHINCDSSERKSYIYISDPKQMETDITGLKPFSTYKFALSLNTTYGLKTIENAETIVTTTEDTPTSPRNVTITDVTYDSLVISWDPPLHKNGIIDKYVIYNHLDEFYVVKVDKHTEKWSVKLKGLEGFSNYSLSVVACNTGINSCSKKSPKNGIFVRTQTGAPSKVKALTINVNPDLIEWERPANTGSFVQFQVLRVKDNNYENIFNTTKLSLALEFCEGTATSEKYQVRAINFVKDPKYGELAEKMADKIHDKYMPLHENKDLFEYLGEWSDPIMVVCKNKCSNE